MKNKFVLRTTLKRCFRFKLWHALILSICLSSLPLNQIYASENVTQQHESILVKGKVTDSKGEPLIGVNVYEASNMSNGVITDYDGNYALTLTTDDAEIIFSYIGFVQQKIKVEKRNLINVVLKDEFNDLDEVVVVGYGTQKKINMTGAVATVDNKIIEDRPSENLLKSIQGTVPGVVIIDRPEGATINIRGRGNLGASDPLYIVDGVEVSSSFFSTLDPNSIENLSFLKDASSAAIYGAKAAYGVVLVKTKSASKKNQLEVTYNGSIGFSKPTYLPKTVSSYDYARLYRVAALNSNPNQEPYFTEEMLEHYRKGDNPDLYPNTDWMDLLMNDNPITTKHSLQFAGATEKLNYNLGIGYMNYENFSPGIENDRYNFSLKVSRELRSWITINASANMTIQKYDRTTGGSNWYQALVVPPTQVAKHSNGQWGTIRNGQEASAYEINSNPLRNLEEGGRGDATTKHFLGSLSAIVKPMANMTWTTQISYNNMDYREHTFVNKKVGIKSFLHPDQGNIIGTEGTLNQMKWSSQYDEKVVYDSWVNYSKTLQDTHNFDLMAGVHADDWETRQIRVGRKHFASNDMEAISGGSTDPDDQITTNEIDDYHPLGHDFIEENNVSAFGRVSYNYLQRYLLEANFRADANSRFADGHRWGYFPSFSAGWRINEEGFMSDFTWLDNLKLRASWGQNGNINNIGRYDTYSTYSAGGTYVLGNAVQNYLSEGRIANPDLTWETVETTDIGIDGMIKQGMFSFTVDYYYRLTKDILIQADDIAIETGISDKVPARNVGEVFNRGIEFSLTHQNQIGDFGYVISGNMNFNHNEIKSLGENVNELPPSGNYIYRVGESIGSFYMYDTDGLYSTKDIEDGKAIAFGARLPEAGMVKFVDQITEDTDGDGKPDAGDGVINDKDKVICGNDVPKLTYGLNLNLTYKNWGLSVLGQGVSGTKVLLTGEASQMFFDSSVPREWQKDYWTEDNQNAKYPKLFVPDDPRYKYNTGDAYKYENNSYWLFDADYFRIKNITLSYTLPKNVLKEYGIGSARIYIATDNPFTFRADKRMEDFEPERSSGRSASFLNKTYVAGINVSF